MNDAEIYKQFKAGSEELVARLVEDHLGWSSSIARSVARAWNMDWQLDGLDGGAYEALLFCARRYDPAMNVPFRAYARRRIHESSTEEARKSKSWQRGTGSGSEEQIAAREISAKLFDVFPELREGHLPFADGEGEEGLRGSIRQLLASASMLATLPEGGNVTPETVAQYRQILTVVAELESVHQQIVWAVYWNGQSMRNLAEEWKIDELAVIREHKEILGYVSSRLSAPKGRLIRKLKVRPGLRAVQMELRKKPDAAPFARFESTAVLLILSFIELQQLASALFGYSTTLWRI